MDQPTYLKVKGFPVGTPMREVAQRAEEAAGPSAEPVGVHFKGDGGHIDVVLKVPGGAEGAVRKAFAQNEVVEKSGYVPPERKQSAQMNVVMLPVGKPKPPSISDTKKVMVPVLEEAGLKPKKVFVDQRTLLVVVKFADAETAWKATDLRGPVLDGVKLPAGCGGWWALYATRLERAERADGSSVRATSAAASAAPPGPPSSVADGPAARLLAASAAPGGQSADAEQLYATRLERAKPEKDGSSVRAAAAALSPDVSNLSSSSDALSCSESSCEQLWEEDSWWEARTWRFEPYFSQGPRADPALFPLVALRPVACPCAQGSCSA